VDGHYVVNGKQIRFKVGAFDKRKHLVIDPVLSYATLLGTGGGEQGNSIAVDSQGNAYITGITSAGNFPTTAGALQTTGNFGGAFVSKLDATGSNLIYSTYLAGVTGNGQTVGTGIAVEIPPGHAGLVLPRSGLALRHGIALVNAPGLIDSGYRGEIRVLLLNTDAEHPFELEPGQRVAQLVIVAVATPPIVEADALAATLRGEGGFGSSGSGASS